MGEVTQNLLVLSFLQITACNMCIIEAHRCTCGCIIACREKNEKAWTLGDEEGLNACCGHES